jgi:hypothetical protein
MDYINGTTKYNLRVAQIWEGTCDGCESQEVGNHYCLLHSISIQNMDLMVCDDYEDRT